MTDVLSRIVGPVGVASGDSSVFTGTAGTVYTIKEMTIVNTGGVPVTITLGINGTTDGDLILPTRILGAGESAEWHGTLVLTGEETLDAHTGDSGLTFTASGVVHT